jgi:hypothetical protein
MQKNTKKPKILAVINHYYGKGKDFKGKSTCQKKTIRKNIVEKTIKSLSTFPNIDIKICGLRKESLVNIDKDFTGIEDPSFIIYESIEWMVSQIDNYDYFINIEDDILLDYETFDRVVEFDKKNKINECFHPNRIEYDGDDEYCIDLRAWSGWRDAQKKYNGNTLRVAINPHSGITILSKEKLEYASKNINFKRREKMGGHYMFSAYANLHEPFLMYRMADNINGHRVIHLDNWNPKNRKQKTKKET